MIFKLFNHDDWLSVSLFAQTSLIPSIVDKAENKGFLICGYVNNCEMLLRTITEGEISTSIECMIVTTIRELYKYDVMRQNPIPKLRFTHCLHFVTFCYAFYFISFTRPHLSTILHPAFLSLTFMTWASSYLLKFYAKITFIKMDSFYTDIPELTH